jgi:hypothetical protein
MPAIRLLATDLDGALIGIPRRVTRVLLIAGIT